MKGRLVIRVLLVCTVISSIAIFPCILDISLTPRFICLAAFLCVGSFTLIQSENKTFVKFDPILLTYLLYVIFCCVSIYWANTCSEAIFEASKTVLGFFVFLFCYYAFRKEHNYFFTSLLKVSVSLFFISLVVIIYELLNLKEFNGETIYELRGLNGHKNLFSSYLFLNLFFLLMASLKLQDSWKNAARLYTVLNFAVLILLRTKAVWLGLAVVVICTLILLLFYLKAKSRISKIKSWLFLCFLLAVLNIFFFKVLQPTIQKGIHYTSNLQSEKVGTNSNTIKLEEERLVLWDKTYQLIHKRPFAGVGMGNWQVYLPDATLSGLWRAEDLNYTFQRPHNDFLWILSETGLIGFNLFLLFLCSLLYYLAGCLRRIPSDKHLAMEIILCFGFISGYFVISFFDFPKERAEHTLWINIMFALAYYYIQQYVTPKKFVEIKTTSWLIFLTSLFIGFIGYIGVLRLSGEFFTKKMYDYKNAGDLQKVIDMASSAQSFAYSLDPTSVPLSWYSGNANAALGNYSQAKKDFIVAYKLNPFNRNVLNDLGSACVFNNEVMLAKTYYEEAARISPRFDEPKLNLAAMYINAGDSKTANKWLHSIFHDSERRSNYQKVVDLNLNQQKP